MATENPKDIVRRFFEAFEGNDQAALKALLAPNQIAYLPGDTEPVNRETFLGIVQRWHSAFSDLRFTLEQQIAERDTVANRITITGVHNRGAFMDLPPLGKPVSVTVMTIERIADGQIVERRVVFDLLDFTQQIESTAIPS